jgi:hypothetical protein
LVATVAVLIAALGGGVAIGMARSDRTAPAAGVPGAAGPSAAGPSASGPSASGPSASGTSPTDGPSPTGTSTGTPAPAPATSPPAAAEIPPQAMLRPADLSTSAPVRVTGTTGVASLHRTEPNACSPSTAYPTDRDRIAARTAGYSTPSEPESGGTYEAVVRYRPGRAAETLAGLRRALAACPGGRRDADWTYRYVLERQRFAGDDALLVRQRGVMDGSDRIWGPHIAIVRIGDYVITVETEVGEGVSIAERAVRLARAAAGRASAAL